MVVEPASELCFVQVTGNFLVCNSLEAHLQEIHLLFVELLVWYTFWARKPREIRINYLFFCPRLSTAGSRSFTALEDY